MPTITYTWKIEHLDCVHSQDELTNIVCKIHWRLYGSDGFYTLNLYGDTQICGPDPENFVEYDNLTESAVIQWLKDSINESANEERHSVIQLETSLENMLAAKRETMNTPRWLPW
jgi:hypothetical protein